MTDLHAAVKAALPDRDIILAAEVSSSAYARELVQLYGRICHALNEHPAVETTVPPMGAIMDAIHGGPVVTADILGVWECVCGAPIKPIRTQAERVAALLRGEDRG